MSVILDGSKTVYDRETGFECHVVGKLRNGDWMIETKPHGEIRKVDEKLLTNDKPAWSGPAEGYYFVHPSKPIVPQGPCGPPGSVENEFYLKCMKQRAEVTDRLRAEGRPGGDLTMDEISEMRCVLMREVNPKSRTVFVRDYFDDTIFPFHGKGIPVYDLVGKSIIIWPKGTVAHG